MLGYSQIPAYWKQGLAEVEPIDFKYTTISLNRTYEMSMEQALEVSDHLPIWIELIIDSTDEFLEEKLGELS